MRSAAIGYIESGISVIPTDLKSKQPTIQTWKPYQSKIMDGRVADEFLKADSLAMVGGKVSGGLEILDFDNHFGDAHKILSDFMRIVEVEEVIKKYDLPIETTQRGGFHLFFRSTNCGTSKKLASRAKRDGKPDTLIETKGEGGYVITSPSDGYVVKRGNLLNIPVITEDERDVLITAACSFNEYAAKEDYCSTSMYSGAGDRPGDEYNRDPAAIDEAKALLSAHGWKTWNGTHWTRPGKKKGVSATFGKVGKNVFYNFSPNSHPFEDRKAYTPWQIFAILEHNFDFQDAAKALAQRGYGSKKNDSLKIVYNKVRTEVRKGAKLAPMEINAMAEELSIPVDTVCEAVSDAEEKYKEEWEFEKKPAIVKAEIFLKQNYEFRCDEISRLPYMRSNGGGKWEKLNEHTVYRYMQHENIKFSKEKLNSLLASDFVQRYNPFVDYFNKLKKWDGKDYIGELAGHIKTSDADFFRKMLEKALVRNIACAILPDYYNRIVFTIVSEKQEIGKSYFIQWLNPFGADYYTDEPLFKADKDARIRLTENFIYNLEELDNLNRMELGQMKATFSKRGVKDRLPYDRFVSYFPRCCSFWGSTNRRDFLVDDRNTRWLCFYVDDIDWDYSKIDKNQLWAQAWHLFNTNGYNYNLTSEEAASRDIENEDYRVIDYELSLLQKHFEPSENEWMTNADIMIAMVDKSENKLKLNTSPQKLGRLLSQLGYQRRKAGNQRGWKIKIKQFDPMGDLNQEDINDTPF